MVEFDGGVDRHPLLPCYIGQIGVGLPPFGELQRCIQVEVILAGILVVDVVDIDDVRVIRVGEEILLNFIRLQVDAGRQRIFVPSDKREADIVGKRGVEQWVSCLVGVVRNLIALWVELPERRT